LDVSLLGARGRSGGLSRAALPPPSTQHDYRDRRDPIPISGPTDRSPRKSRGMSRVSASGPRRLLNLPVCSLGTEHQRRVEWQRAEYRKGQMVRLARVCVSDNRGVRRPQARDSEAHPSKSACHRSCKSQARQGSRSPIPLSRYRGDLTRALLDIAPVSLMAAEVV
jgi:hypothetical protein